jgi:ABC-type nitrate/sulfonate/bicarbonate transport system ATPase subunit
VIEITNVEHRFQTKGAENGGLTVLDGVSLTIQDGEFVSFLGPSGCGKTTLLRILDGLVTPSAGQVVIDGKAVKKPARERAMVFQEFNLLPWRTTVRNVEFGLELQGTPRSQRTKIARENLRKVGLGGFEGYFPHQLSGGMKQRVGIARALSVSPNLLLMDEPFGALDPQIRELMQIEMLKLLESEARTVVFVTHSVDEAIFLSDRIVIFSARPGRILAVVDVDLPKPRWQDDERIKVSPEFVRYRSQIWHMLKSELQRSQI